MQYPYTVENIKIGGMPEPLGAFTRLDDVKTFVFAYMKEHESDDCAGVDVYENGNILFEYSADGTCQVYGTDGRVVTR